MKLFNLLLFIFFCQNVVGMTTSELIWLSGEKEYRLELIELHQSFLKSSEQAQSSLKKTSFNWKLPSLIGSVIAEEEILSDKFNCLYAGWPSKKIGKFCGSPNRLNPDYKNNSCQQNELHCQPLLFGAGLCAPIATREQRISVTKNCFAASKAKERSIDLVVNEVITEKQEKELFRYFDFVDELCLEAKVPISGVCRTLTEKVASLRDNKQIKKLFVVADSIPDSLDVLLAHPKTKCIEKENKVLFPEISLSEIPVPRIKPTIVKEKKTLELETPSIVIPAIEKPRYKDLTQALDNEEKIFTSPHNYTPELAISDIQNGNLEFMGRDLLPGSDQNRTCIFKSESAYILYNNCMSSKRESEVTDIEIIHFGGTSFSFYVENSADHNNGAVSQMKRESYDATWAMRSKSYGKPGENLSISELKAYMTTRYENVSGGCFIGGTPKYATDPNADGSCWGTDKDKVSNWKNSVEPFWKEPSQQWYEVQKMLRSKVKNAKY